MKYDPILCMMANKSTKTKDANRYKVYGPKGIEVYEAGTKEAAIRKYEIEYGTAVSRVEQVKDDESSKGRTHDVLNNAIKLCDSSKSGI